MCESVLFILAVATHNQSLIGSRLGTPQKVQSLQQQLLKPGKTPTNQPGPMTVSTATPSTPNIVRSLLPVSPAPASLRTPMFGQYNIGTPTPIIGECIFVYWNPLIKLNFQIEHQSF